MDRSERIRSLLESQLAPVHLEIINESHQHSVKPGSETHFKLVVASAAFDGKSSVARQRAVHAALASELALGLHALTMSTFTPAEWEASPTIRSSPPCLGGSKTGS